MKHANFWVSVTTVLLMGANGVAGAQSLVSSANPKDLFDMLGGVTPGDGGMKRKFHYVPTAAPDAATNKCEEGGKSLKMAVVPVYTADSDAPPKADLDIRFRSGTDELDSASHPLLNNLAKALNLPGLQEAQFAVAGHTDMEGNQTETGRRKNLELSCARAKRVRDYLVQQGVDSSRLGTYGFGPNRPLVPNVVKSDINRRVEIRRAN